MADLSSTMTSNTLLASLVLLLADSDLLMHLFRMRLTLMDIIVIFLQR